MWEGHRIDKRLLEDSNKNIPQDSGNREKVRMSTPTTGQFCTNYVLSGFLPTWKDTLIHLAGSQASFLLARGYHSTLTIKLFTIKEEVPCPKGNQNTATRQKEGYAEHESSPPHNNQQTPLVIGAVIC